jgi:N-acyl amino acid synthase of PEP-CTERM/exosortase system
MLIDRLIGRRDILVPYFDFSHLSNDGARSPSMDDIYRLRYEVYCVERNFLDAGDFPNGLEMDSYDHCSAHFAAYNTEQEIVGTVRLVTPEEHHLYPFESHCNVYEDFRFPPRQQAGEISRLVVRKSYRRRRGDSMEGVARDFIDGEPASKAQATPPAKGSDKRNNSPLLLLGMYREMYRYSRRNGIRYWYAAMERSLARSLDRMGFRFVPIGPATDYYGPVTPHIVDLEELNTSLREKNPFLAAWFNDERIPLRVVLRTLYDTLRMGSGGGH